MYRCGGLVSRLTQSSRGVDCVRKAGGASGKHRGSVSVSVLFGEGAVLTYPRRLARAGTYPKVEQGTPVTLPPPLPTGVLAGVSVVLVR